MKTLIQKQSQPPKFLLRMFKFLIAILPESWRSAFLKAGIHVFWINWRNNFYKIIGNHLRQFNDKINREYYKPILRCLTQKIILLISFFFTLLITFSPVFYSLLKLYKALCYTYLVFLFFPSLNPYIPPFSFVRKVTRPYLKSFKKRYFDPLKRSCHAKN